MKTERITAAQKLIEYLGDNGITAAVCGGYARDTICDKPIRDVDLYVQHDHFAFSFTSLSNERRDVLAEEFDAASGEYIHQCIDKQCEFELVDNLDFGLPTRTINLIALRDGYAVNVENIINRYNLGICQAGIDSGGIKITENFRKDYREHQITLFRTDWGHEASLKQFIKLQAKYPWPLRVHKQEDEVEF